MDQKFLNTIAEILKIDSYRIDENSKPETVPEWDSLNHWLLIGKLEDIYNIEFTMDEATEFQNLGDIYSKLKTKLL